MGSSSTRVGSGEKGGVDIEGEEPGRWRHWRVYLQGRQAGRGTRPPSFAFKSGGERLGALPISLLAASQPVLEPSSEPGAELRSRKYTTMITHLPFHASWLHSIVHVAIAQTSPP
ncbi:hypothetical protein M758_7G075900 [Ceratodon purpureus]|nr:hypothetical protein M758_7G075900 [Ceratodon purpureus]